MDYGAIPDVGERISRLVLGSMVFHPDSLDNTFELLDAFVASGGNVVDTAYVYGGGNSERALGMWLRARGARSAVKIVAKGGMGKYPDGATMVSPELIRDQLSASFDRMRVDSVDLYVLHRDDPRVPVGELVDCLNGYVEAGLIRAFGGSNWRHERIAAANEYAARRGVRGFVASSPNLALAVPLEPMWPDCVSISGDREALDWYRQTQLPILAWSSQARGFFSGRFTPESAPDLDVRRVYYSDENWERLSRVRELSTRLGRSLSQVALAWALHQPLNVFPLIGPRNVDELDDSLGALDIELSAEIALWLNLDRDSM